MNDKPVITFSPNWGNWDTSTVDRKDKYWKKAFEDDAFPIWTIDDFQLRDRNYETLKPQAEKDGVMLAELLLSMAPNIQEGLYAEILNARWVCENPEQMGPLDFYYGLVAFETIKYGIPKGLDLVAHFCGWHPRSFNNGEKISASKRNLNFDPDLLPGKCLVMRLEADEDESLGKDMIYEPYKGDTFEKPRLRGKIIFEVKDRDCYKRES
jgi:hypothetical protein